MKRLSDWWSEYGDLLLIAICCAFCVLIVFLAIYGSFVFLKVGWLLTAVVLINTVLAMMMLSYAAPFASTQNMFLAALLWLYGAALSALLVSAALYGAYALVAK